MKSDWNTLITTRFGELEPTKSQTVTSESDDAPLQQHLRLMRNLTGGGVARVPVFDLKGTFSRSELMGLTDFYQSLHENRAADAPGRCPDLNLDAAIWGGMVVHWACWAILDRSQVNVGLPDYLRQSLPDCSLAASHWSVDLMMAAWPDVHSRCRQVSQDDPLKATLHTISLDWPLAAIGTGLDDETVTSSILSGRPWATILENPSLRRIAVDRAIRCGENLFNTSQPTADQ